MSQSKDPTKLLEELNEVLKYNIANVEKEKAKWEMSLVKKREAFASETAAAIKILDQIKQQAKQYKEDFEAEKTKMEQVYVIQTSKVKLDIGGHQFSTSKATLTSPCEPDSMLNAMFSGRHQLHKDEDGSYFIDRDGRNFHHILNYLRDPTNFQLPADSQELLKEAEYYCMSNFLLLFRTRKFTESVVNVFDRNGVIYYLQTNGNPLTAIFSSASGEEVVDTGVVRQPPARSHIQIHPSQLVINLGVVFKITGFTLCVHGCQSGIATPTSFSLYGSNNQTSWEKISDFQLYPFSPLGRTPSRFVAAGFTQQQGQDNTHSWEVESSKKFCFFKFVASPCFHIANVEFYGAIHG